MKAINKLTKLLFLILGIFILNSCAYLKEKAIAYKYRNDFRVNTKWEKGKIYANEYSSPLQDNELVTCGDLSDENKTASKLYYNEYLPIINKNVDLDYKTTVKKNVKLAHKVVETYKKLPKNQKKEIKKNALTNAKGKSQIVTLILAGIFVLTGVAGIHRFYLGGTNNIIIGIIQLLTLGCCGVWWLIDFIRILTGDLKPPTGTYDVEL